MRRHGLRRQRNPRQRSSVRTPGSSRPISARHPGGWLVVSAPDRARPREDRREQSDSSRKLVGHPVRRLVLDRLVQPTDPPWERVEPEEILERLVEVEKHRPDDGRRHAAALLGRRAGNAESDRSEARDAVASGDVEERLVGAWSFRRRPVWAGVHREMRRHADSERDERSMGQEAADDPAGEGVTRDEHGAMVSQAPDRGRSCRPCRSRRDPDGP